MTATDINIDHVIGQLDELIRTPSRSRAQALRQQIQEQIDALIDESDESVDEKETTNVSDTARISNPQHPS